MVTLALEKTFRVRRLCERKRGNPFIYEQSLLEYFQENYIGVIDCYNFLYQCTAG